MEETHPADDLSELLEEARILLPGSEILVAFLISLPFTDRFASLTTPQRWVYIATFMTALIALVCFVMPAAYHRLARPIGDRVRFKVFANKFLIAGTIPLSFALALATYLAASLASSTTVAIIVASIAASFIGIVWWLLPLTRFHDRVPLRASDVDPDAGDAPIDGKKACSKHRDPPRALHSKTGHSRTGHSRTGS